MQSAPLPDHETERLEALYRCRILDSGRERSFDQLAELAARNCETPIATISFIDEDRQWFKAWAGPDQTDFPRRLAMCAHTILETEPMQVCDARLDDRFHDHPMVLNAPHIRAYTGAAVRDANGYALGSLCVIDLQPRQLSDNQLDLLCTLSDQTAKLVELHRATLQLQEAEQAKAQLRVICSHCHAIQPLEADAAERWIPLGRFFAQDCNIPLSHGMCPACYDRHYS